MAESRKGCTARVHDGRMVGGYACSHWAKPNDPDGLCGVHRAAVERRKAEPVREAASAPPREVRVSTTISVSMEWDPDTGPVFPEPYSGSGAVRWRSLHARFTPDGVPHGSASGTGYRLRKDGSEGERFVQMSYATWDRLPVEVRDLFTAYTDTFKGDLS